MDDWPEEETSFVGTVATAIAVVWVAIAAAALLANWLSG